MLLSCLLFVYNNNQNNVFIQNGEQICKLNGRHPNAISAMAFNHFYDTLVTACTHLAIWLPDQQYDQLD